MKQYIIILTAALVLPFTGAKAQIFLGDESKLGASVILDFDDNAKGLVLPNVSTSTDANQKGSMVFDRSDKKVKYFNGTAWVNLTQYDGALTSTTAQTEYGVGTLVSDEKDLSVEPIGALELEKSPY